MIKLIDLLNEVSHGLIGPFYHETDKENIEGILKNGLNVTKGSNSYDMLSLAPAAPSGLYGDAVVQVYLDPSQFKKAVKDTYNTMLGMGMDLVDKRDIELAEKLIDNSITNQEYKELVNRALNNEGFFSGELTVREPIPASQIKTEISEESKGLWYYINRKKKLGIKSTPKNSKAYKAAVKAGKELSNEGIHDPVQPGILKKRLGKLSCTRVKAEKAKLKDKGTHYAKALQRYLNYHCND
jgi:hypothetical protein